MIKRCIFAGVLSVLLGAVIAWVPLQEPSLPADRFKDDFLYRINKVRAEGCSCGKKYFPAAAPLSWNTTLESAAKGHARDMDNNDYFSHTSKNGRSSEDRIIAAGYNFNGYKSFAIGENIAFGQQSIAEVSDGWFKSEGHCRNLMNPDFKEVGISRIGLYWVQDFGGRESFTPEQQRMIKEGGGRLIIRKTRTE